MATHTLLTTHFRGPALDVRQVCAKRIGRALAIRIKLCCRTRYFTAAGITFTFRK